MKIIIGANIKGKSMQILQLINEISICEDWSYEERLLGEIEMDLEDRKFDSELAVFYVTGEKEIQLAKKINLFNPNCVIICIVPDKSYLPHLCAVENQMVLFEDQIEACLLSVIQMADERIEIGKRKVIKLTNRNDCYVLKQKNIICALRDDRRTVIHTTKGSYYTYLSLTNLESQLTEKFVKCSSSALINLDKIVKKKGNSLVMENGKNIMITRTYKKAIENKLKNL